MLIERTWRDGCVVVALTGQLNLFTAPQVQRELCKQLGEQPLAVICDLTGVDFLDPVCGNLFSAVANHPSSYWPGTTFLLCGAQLAVAEVLGRLRVPQFVRLYHFIFRRITHGASRLQEINADRVAARLCGRDAFEGMARAGQLARPGAGLAPGPTRPHHCRGSD